MKKCIVVSQKKNPFCFRPCFTFLKMGIIFMMVSTLAVILFICRKKREGGRNTQTKQKSGKSPYLSWNGKMISV